VLNWTKETGDLPRRQSNVYDIVFGQHSAEPAVSLLDIWKKNDRGGLVFRLGGSNRRKEGPSYLSDTISIFPASSLEETQRIMQAAPLLKERLVCWRDGGVIQG
jgi:hypothetical protein